MRLRNVKGSRETIADNKYVVHDEESMKGKWSEFFGNTNPIHIEIGMGKGQFIMELARRNPDINYLGALVYVLPALLGCCRGRLDKEREYGLRKL